MSVLAIEGKTMLFRIDMRHCQGVERLPNSIVPLLHGHCHTPLPSPTTRVPFASFQALRLLNARVGEQLSIPQSKGWAERTPELGLDGVNDLRFLDVHKAQHTSLVVQQDAHTFRLTYQRDRYHLIGGHGKPLALDITKHPGGAVRAHAVVSRHQCLSHAQSELLGLLNSHLPVMASIRDLFIPKHHRPLPEALLVMLDTTGMQAQDAIDNTCVFLEEVQTAMCSPFIQLEMDVYEEERKEKLQYHCLPLAFPCILSLCYQYRVVQN